MSEDDRIKVIALDIVKTELSDFTNTVCDIKHKEVDIMRKKIDKIYTIAIGLLVGLITTLVAVILK